MKNLPGVLLLIIAACIASAGSSSATGQKDASKEPTKEQEARRPKLILRSQTMVAISPARIVLTAELLGGSDDFEEYYCPTVEWDWGDDTRSESRTDCEPYEGGRSQIKRRYTVEHIFRRPGVYKVYFHLKRQSKTISSSSVSIQVRPGGPD